MNILEKIASLDTVMIKQKRELAELFGFETRNKYQVETVDGQPIAYAAEQQKGIFGMIFRQALGHWKTYTINIYDPGRALQFVAHHPFRIYFQKLEVSDALGNRLGYLERRFEILGKRFDLIDKNGVVAMTVRSPIWRIWTFPFKSNGRERAVVTKKWGGIIKEVFLDADDFALKFSSPDIPPEQRILLLAAAIFIDLRYFEKKAKGGPKNAANIFNNRL